MQYDAIVIGGSFAGLSAAMQIARARRSVCVIDTGRPRNRFSDASHGFFGQDGSNPLVMIASARSQIQRYPTVQTMTGEASAACAVDGGFEVMLDDRSSLKAAKLVLAFGVSDILPDLPGLAERWGKSVLHCPYCHGFEFAGRRLGVLQTMEMSSHQALLIAEWGPTTLYLNGGDAPGGETLKQLAKRGIAVEPARIVSLQGESGTLSYLRLDDGRVSPVAALYLAPKTDFNSPIAKQLGCGLQDSPLGLIIRTDERKQTSVPGVYAAGDIARAPHNASWAVADGATAGVFLHQSLALDSTAS